MKKSTIFLLTILMTTLSFAAKNKHEIKIKVNGMNDSIAYLASYYGKYTILKDTAVYDSKSKSYIFDGEDVLDGGSYLFVNQAKAMVFEFLVNEQFFSLSTDTGNIIQGMEIKNSPENDLFFGHIKYTMGKRKIVEGYSNRIKVLGKDHDSTNIYRDKIKDIDTEVRAMMKSKVEENGNSLFAKIIKAGMEIELPEELRPENHKGDTTVIRNYFKYLQDHYFDNWDFADERLLHTNMYDNKLNYYIERLVVQIPDSINPHLDRLLALAQTNNEMFKYTLNRVTYHYETSKLMGIDAVFVHLAENYYLKDMAFWMNEKQLKKVEDRYNTLNPILLGKVAPDLLMISNDLKTPIRLSQVKADHIILITFDPDCGHCKKAIPKIKKTYDKFKDKGLKVFAILNASDLEKWNKFITDKGLSEWINVCDGYNNSNFRKKYDVRANPTVFLLDGNHKIVAKGLGAEQLDDFISKHVYKVKPIGANESSGVIETKEEH